MAEIQKINGEDLFQQVFNTAAQLPGVRIDRDKYLAGALNGKFSPSVVTTAIETSPAAAGIEPEKLSKIADSSISYETAKVTALSTAAGIPGGFAVAGTVPADMAQFFAHILRIAQKLAYLYGWDNLFEGKEEEMSDSAKNMLILFVGVMFGAQAASSAVSKISAVAAEAVAKRLPQQHLTKGFIYPIVKKVAIFLGYEMNKEIFGKTVSKMIPFVGGVISGGITLATYAPMCIRLKNYLAELEVADPETYIVELVDIEPIEMPEPEEI